jgi:hypothetical protein
MDNVTDCEQQYFETNDPACLMQRSRSVFSHSTPDDISLNNNWAAYSQPPTLPTDGSQEYWINYPCWQTTTLGEAEVPELTDYASTASQPMSREASGLSTFSSFDQGAFEQNQPQTHILAGLEYAQDQSQDLLQSPLSYYPPVMDEYSYLPSPNATYSHFGSFPNPSSFIPSEQKSDIWFKDLPIPAQYVPRRHSSPSPSNNAPKRVRMTSTTSSKPKRALPSIKITTAQDMASKPKPARAFCLQCSEHPSGFHGQHELERHMLRKHSPHKTVWVVKDGVKFGSSLRVKKSLEGCEECAAGKRYMQPYNVAAQ